MTSSRLTLFFTSAVGAMLLAAPSSLLAQNSASKMDNGSAKMMKSGDSMFAMKAAQGGLAEVQLGQLATQKATSADVKAFGQKMVDDHTKANDQLKAVASEESMTLPSSLTPKDSALYTKLQNESGSKFDHDYVKAMVKDHEEDVKEFQKEANAGKDAKVKSFASETLPTLQMHLQDIQKIESGMGGK